MCKRPYLTLYALQTLEVWGENRPFLGGIFFLRVFSLYNGRYPTPKIYFLFYFQMSQNAFKKKSKLLTNLYSFHNLIHSSIFTSSYAPTGLQLNFKCFLLRKNLFTLRSAVLILVVYASGAAQWHFTLPQNSYKPSHDL